MASKGAGSEKNWGSILHPRHTNEGFYSFWCTLYSRINAFMPYGIITLSFILVVAYVAGATDTSNTHLIFDD